MFLFYIFPKGTFSLYIISSTLVQYFESLALNKGLL